MGKVRFYQPGDEEIYITPVRPLYTVNLTKPGDYYPAEQVERLIAAARNVIKWHAPEYTITSSWDKLKAAIAELEG